MTLFIIFDTFSMERHASHTFDDAEALPQRPVILPARCKKEGLNTHGRAATAAQLSIKNGQNTLNVRREAAHAILLFAARRLP